MALPVVKVAGGGLPVTIAAAGYGLPCEIASNGYGIPITLVASGALAIADPKGTIGGGGNGPPGTTGLIGWWDVSVTASLNLTGTDINSVADQSGGGHTMNWYNQKPVYSATGGTGGRPQMVCAVGCVLRTTAFPMGTGNTITMWYVGTTSISGSFSDARMLAYFAPAQQDWNYIGSWALTRSGTSASTTIFLRNSSSASNTPTAYPAMHRFIVTVRSDGLCTLYVDGVSAGSFTQSGNWTTAGDLYFGNSTVGANWNGGNTTEFGVATGYSDATAVAQLDSYLKTKWGL